MNWSWKKMFNSKLSTCASFYILDSIFVDDRFIQIYTFNCAVNRRHIDDKNHRYIFSRGKNVAY